MNELDLLQQVANRNMHAITGDDGRPVSMPSSGQYVGRLRIETELGRGGVGAVFKTIDPETGAVRAVKIPFPDNSRRDLDRFRMEAKICANLEHENIVRVYSTGLINGALPYMEMDYVQGKSLRDYIKENPLPVPVALSMISLLCTALEYTHSRSFNIGENTYERLIHRDIKPSNIVVSEQGIVKILDFGLAKFEDVELHNTITGALPGTPAYMAPEQHQRPVANVKTDVYSIGVTLYEAITGARPFPEEGEDSFMRMITAKNSGDFKPAGEIAENVPSKVDDIITRCLHPEPSKRYPTYAPLRMAVNSVLEDYARIEPESIVKMYFSNRKAYTLAIPTKIAKNQGRSIRMLALGGIATLALALLTAILLWWPASEQTDTAAPSLGETPDIAPLSDETTPPPPSAQMITPEKTKTPEVMKSPEKTDVPRIEKPKGKIPVRSVGGSRTPNVGNKPSDESPIASGVKEYERGNYETVLEELSSVETDNLRAIQRDSVVLMMMEAFFRTDRYNEGLVYGMEHPTNDAKYHLLMALLYDFASMGRQAEAAFGKAITSPAKFNSDDKKKAYLFRARFYQRQYNSDESDTSRDKMIAAWKDVLNKTCTQPSDECEEARRIVGE